MRSLEEGFTPYPCFRFRRLHPPCSGCRYFYLGIFGWIGAGGDLRTARLGGRERQRQRFMQHHPESLFSLLLGALGPPTFLFKPMKAKPCTNKTSPKRENTQAPLPPFNGALPLPSSAPAKWPDWLSVKEAAGILNVSSATIRRLRETVDPCSRRPFLLSCKPTPRTILISAVSVQEHQRASQQLEFWETREKIRLRRPGRPRQRKRQPAKANRGSCTKAASKRN